MARALLRVALLLSLPHLALSGSLCKGIVGEPPDGDPTVCCAKGCGQSREQCQETDDVCKGTRKGDETTKANCCPSVIKASAVKCSTNWGTACVLDEDGGKIDDPPPPPIASPPPSFAPPVACEGEGGE